MKQVSTDDCWHWAKSIKGVEPRAGYGYIIAKLDGRWTSVYAHRVVYENFVGPIPEGYVIDHLCRVHRCVNPDHMEAVTNAENVRRGLAGWYQRIKTHCKNGHEFTPENTLYWPPTQYRRCRICRNASRRGQYKRKMEKLRARGV